ncbi:MAG: sulfotransferase family 2 domain-containing protein [Bacteroidota bacterium]
MIELLSIHIPKTGGTSFYHLLQEVYGNSLSISYKRRDYKRALRECGSLERALPAGLRVLHGHLYYRELAALHRRDRPKVICWLRHPVDRVVSNFRFFKAGLRQPDRNRANYEQNKHRIDESLLEYARMAENCNRMSDFLDGLALEDLFFIGFLEQFEEDVRQLGRLLAWPPTDVPQLNRGEPKSSHQRLTRAEWQELAKLNSQDMALYRKACKLRGISEKPSL